MDDFDPSVDPFVRATDPETSREAAERRPRTLKPSHHALYGWQRSNQESDRNAGLFAAETGFAPCAETGRRLNRDLKEEGFLEYRMGPDGEWLKVKNRHSTCSGNRCFPTQKGEQWYADFASSSDADG
jgi:hypothetical protein